MILARSCSLSNRAAALAIVASAEYMGHRIDAGRTSTVNTGCRMDTIEIVTRLAMASGAGLLLGLDRELRGISAGIRTHALVAMSSALITISALILYVELRDQPGVEIDPLRVIQGLAQAIGFVAAGAVFVSKGNVHNLTSAANIWLAASIGIAAGAGQTTLVAAGIVFGIVIVTIVRLVERFIPGSGKAGPQ